MYCTRNQNYLLWDRRATMLGQNYENMAFNLTMVHVSESHSIRTSASSVPLGQNYKNITVNLTTCI